MVSTAARQNITSIKKPIITLSNTFLVNFVNKNKKQKRRLKIFDQIIAELCLFSTIKKKRL